MCLEYLSTPKPANFVAAKYGVTVQSLRYRVRKYKMLFGERRPCLENGIIHDGNIVFTPSVFNYMDMSVSKVSDDELAALLLKGGENNAEDAV